MSHFCVSPLPLALSLSCPPGESHPLAPPLPVLCLFHHALALHQPSSFGPLSTSCPPGESHPLALLVLFLHSLFHPLPFFLMFTIFPLPHTSHCHLRRHLPCHHLHCHCTIICIFTHHSHPRPPTPRPHLRPPTVRPHPRPTPRPH